MTLIPEPDVILIASVMPVAPMTFSVIITHAR
jgi:hypothetical protein